MFSDRLREAWPGLKRYTTHFHVKDAVPPDRRGLPPYPAPLPEDRLMQSVRPAGQDNAGRADSRTAQHRRPFPCLDRGTAQSDIASAELATRLRHGCSAR